MTSNRPNASRPDREPPVEVSEEPARVTVTATLPGLDRRQLDLRVRGRRLSIRAGGSDDDEPLRRIVPLPTAVREEEAVATYEADTLHVTLPKDG